MSTVSTHAGLSVKSKSTDELIQHLHGEHHSNGSGEFTHIVQRLHAERMKNLQEQNEANHKQVAELTAKINSLEEELRTVQAAEQAKLKAQRSSCC